MTSPLLAEILGPDLIIVLLVIGLLFGSSKLPDLARALGSAKSEFEKGLQGGPEETSVAPPPPAEAEQVTLTRAELDALIAEREARARTSPEPTPGE